MRRIATIWLVLIAVATLAFSWQSEEASPIPYEWNGVERIIAIGDVHGAYDGLVAILKQTELVDKKLRWIGGKTHLVQMGDLMDRGPESRKAMELLEKLEQKAEDEGGRVHVLIGNHEAMNIAGILDYVSKEEIESYRDRLSEERRDRVFRRRFENMIVEAKAKGVDKPSEKEERRKFEEEYPLGYIEHRLAFRPDGEYGSWILQHNVSIKINGIIFSHGDWNEKWAAVGLGEVNRRMRAELAGINDIRTGVTFAEDSPVQNRRFSKVPLKRDAQEAARPELERVLEALEASRIVVGHTVTHGGIEPRFGGKHLSVDAGMSGFYGGGKLALEIEGAHFRAIHLDGKMDLPEYLDESNLADYVVAVAAIDRENVVVRYYLVDLYRSRGDLDAAWSAMEGLLNSDLIIPDPYVKSICNLHGVLARPELEPIQWITVNCR